MEHRRTCGVALTVIATLGFAPGAGAREPAERAIYAQVQSGSAYAVPLFVGDDGSVAWSAGARSYRWGGGREIVRLSARPRGASDDSLYLSSGDGRVVYGITSVDGRLIAFWGSRRGSVALRAPGEVIFSQITAATQDGRFAGGMALSGSSGVALVARANGTYSALAPLPGDDVAEVSHLAGDGRRAAGWSCTSFSCRAVVWQNDIAESLALPGDDASVVEFVAADLSVIGGRSCRAYQCRPFHWEVGAGLRALDPPAGFATHEAPVCAADGRVRFGRACMSSGECVLTRWAANALEVLGAPPRGSVESVTRAVGDGSAAFLLARVPARVLTYYWDAQRGFVALTLPGANRSDVARAAPDGSSATGSACSYPGCRSFRWRRDEATVEVVTAPLGRFLIGPTLLTPDGETVVARTCLDAYVRDSCKPVRWDAARGVASLVLPGDLYGEILRVEGGLAIGASCGASGCTAFTWSQAVGQTPIAPLPGDAQTSVMYATRDGRNVVGRSCDFTWRSCRLIVHDAIRGTRSLEDAVRAAGGDVSGAIAATGWTFSPNGRFLGGHAADGWMWRVDLRAVFANPANGER